MKFWEAARAVTEGKKVRRVDWDYDVHIHLDELDEYCHDFNKDWIIVTEDPYLDWPEVLKGLQKGKKYRREYWSAFIFMTAGGRICIAVDGNEMPKWHPTIDDFTAKDWIEDK